MSASTPPHLGGALVSLALAAPLAAQSFDPQLTAASHFPVPGGSLELVVDGPPGALFGVHAAPIPAEIPLGAIGTLYLDPLTQFQLGGGVLDAGGSGGLSLQLPPNPDLVDGELFLQAGVVALPDVRATNAIAVRISAAPPSGRRTTISLAVTPDGARAYAAHRDDGSLTVVDAQANAVLAQVPIGPPATHLLHRPVAVDAAPDGGRVVALNAAAERLTVLDAASGSVVALVPAPRGCKRATFDLTGPQRLLYVTNEALDAVLVWREGPFATYTPLPAVPLEGRGPGPLVVLDGGRLLVGDQGTHELELVDPSLPPGSGTVARTPIGGLPFDLVVAEGEVLVATFTATTGPTDGTNRVLRVDPSTAGILGQVWTNLGTDYVDLALGGGFAVATAAGSGSIVVADAASGAVLDVVDLGPSQPVFTPEQAAVVPGPGGAPVKLYVANRFRETIRSVDLSAGPPFGLGAEIALAHSGAPRVPLLDLLPEEDGDWFFRSVQFFNGTPATPNLVTCASCHPDAGAFGPSFGALNVPHMFRLGQTSPYLWKGTQSGLGNLMAGAFNAHGTVGGALSPIAHVTIVAYLDHAVEAPPSPFLALDGSLTPEQVAGKALFEGAAGCAACHTAPDFLPPPTAPKTIAGGVGTGLAPANVPTLLGSWSTAPYLHDGSAPTLRDVLELDTGDQHGVTSGLSPYEVEVLVEFLRTL